MGPTGMRTEKLDLCKICGKMFLKIKDITVCPTCAPQKYLPRFTAQPESSPILATKNGKPIKENVNVQKDGKWSLKYERCVRCGGNGVKHVARGLCLNCYWQESEKRNRGKQRLRKGLASNKLDHKYLYEEYMNKKRSLGDIAKDCNCSRQYVQRSISSAHRI